MPLSRSAVLPLAVRVQGEITAWAPQSASGSLRVRVAEIPSGVLTAEIHVAFSLHETRTASPQRANLSQGQTDGKPVVLLTGASGGLGREIAAVLSESYHVSAWSGPDPIPAERHRMD